MITVALPRLGVITAPPPNGVDDTAALAALIGPSRTIQLQPGTYNVSGAIGVNCDSITNLVIQGASGEWFTNAGSVINYGGAGTAISMRGTGGSTDGCVIRNLAVNANNAAILIDFGTTSGTATNPGTSNCKLEKVSLNSTSTTNILWNLAQAISCHADDCAFVGGGVAIQGVTTANGFSNTHTIEASYFTGATTIAIKNPCQNWTIQGNTFEPLAGTIAGALTHDGTVSAGIAGSLGLTIIGNSFQDSATSAGSAWVTVRGQGITIIGNDFLSHADTHIKTLTAVVGLAIIGNVFLNDDVNPVNFGAAPTQFVMLGNQWNSAHLLGGTTPGVPSFWMTNGNQMHLGQHLDLTGGLALWGVAAQASQQAAVGAAAGYTAGATVATFHSDDTYTGNTGTTGYTINGIVLALKNQGLLAT